MEKDLANKNDLVRADDLSQLEDITERRTEEENQINGRAVNITIEQAINEVLRPDRYLEKEFHFEYSDLVKQWAARQVGLNTPVISIIQSNKE